MSAVVQIDDNNFQSEVIDSGSAVLLDFYADWCGPCKQIAPVLDDIATKYEDKGLKVGKVNIEEAQSLALKFNITGVPTLLFFKGGEQVDQIVGAQSQPVIENKVETLL